MTTRRRFLQGVGTAIAALIAAPATLFAKSPKPIAFGRVRNLPLSLDPFADGEWHHLTIVVENGWTIRDESPADQSSYYGDFTLAMRLERKQKKTVYVDGVKMPAGYQPPIDYHKAAEGDWTFDCRAKADVGYHNRQPILYGRNAQVPGTDRGVMWQFDDWMIDAQHDSTMAFAAVRRGTVQPFGDGLIICKKPSDLVTQPDVEDFLSFDEVQIDDSFAGFGP